jgi:hypothetical protein
MRQESIQDRDSLVQDAMRAGYDSFSVPFGVAQQVESSSMLRVPIESTREEGRWMVDNDHSYGVSSDGVFAGGSSMLRRSSVGSSKLQRTREPAGKDGNVSPLIRDNVSSATCVPMDGALAARVFDTTNTNRCLTGWRGRRRRF